MRASPPASPAPAADSPSPPPRGPHSSPTSRRPHSGHRTPPPSSRGVPFNSYPHPTHSPRRRRSDPSNRARPQRHAPSPAALPDVTTTTADPAPHTSSAAAHGYRRSGETTSPNSEPVALAPAPPPPLFSAGGTYPILVRYSSASSLPAFSSASLHAALASHGRRCTQRRFCVLHNAQTPVLSSVVPKVIRNASPGRVRKTRVYSSALSCDASSTRCDCVSPARSRTRLMSVSRSPGSGIRLSRHITHRASGVRQDACSVTSHTLHASDAAAIGNSHGRLIHRHPRPTTPRRRARPVSASSPPS